MFCQGPVTSSMLVLSVRFKDVNGLYILALQHLHTVSTLFAKMLTSNEVVSTLQLRLPPCLLFSDTQLP